jgi:hypothetical protein
MCFFFSSDTPFSITPVARTVLENVLRFSPMEEAACASLTSTPCMKLPHRVLPFAGSVPILKAGAAVVWMVPMTMDPLQCLYRQKIISREIRMNRLSVLAFAVAAALVAGLVILVFSIWFVVNGYGKAFIDAFVSIHTEVFVEDGGLLFVLVNTAFALIDGFILGFLLAVAYNRLGGLFNRNATTGGEGGS